MAELNVQRKKRSVLPWILLILGIIALLFFLLRGYKNSGDAGVVTGDTTAATSNLNAADTSAGWDSVDFNAPAATYPEITDSNITVRSNDRYSIYGLGENILFDEGKSTVRQDAAKNLQQITNSIKQRYKDAPLRVYGYTDAIGSAGYNKELAEQRATAVRDWLLKNGIDNNQVSLQPVGEARPIATNTTSEGRQQNRRVEIVARGSQSAQQ